MGQDHTRRLGLQGAGGWAGHIGDSGACVATATVLRAGCRARPSQASQAASGNQCHPDDKVAGILSPLVPHPKPWPSVRPLLRSGSSGSCDLEGPGPSEPVASHCQAESPRGRPGCPAQRGAAIPRRMAGYSLTLWVQAGYSLMLWPLLAGPPGGRGPRAGAAFPQPPFCSRSCEVQSTWSAGGHAAGRTGWTTAPARQAGASHDLSSNPRAELARL